MYLRSLMSIWSTVRKPEWIDQLSCIYRGFALAEQCKVGWVVCLSFPSTFCPPGSHCCLDQPSLPLSTSSTISRCFLNLVYSCICEGFPSCSSHIPLFLLCGYMLRREIFFRNCDFGHEFSRVKSNSPLLQVHLTLRRADYLHSYEQD